MSTLTDITAKIADFAEDVATLDVLTLTGSITLKPDPDAAAGDEGTKKLKWDKFFKEVAGKINGPDAASKLEIVAYTHTEIDLDSVNYYRADPGSDKLCDLHKATVESATKARMDALAAFANALKNL